MLVEIVCDRCGETFLDSEEFMRCRTCALLRGYAPVAHEDRASDF